MLPRPARHLLLLVLALLLAAWLLNRPNAVAVAANGDLYVADTFNHRIRVIAQATGVIRTVAGNGTPGVGDAIGDGGPATSAHLNQPTDIALAANGDVYIADMGHNRVRVIDARTGIISTVANRRLI